MHIRRVQIEEGFLDGFETDLSLGLNVVIGARGTGKTSLIELIRFCLGATGNTPESTRRSRDHALSVLGSGQITLTLADDNGVITVSRSASDDSPRSTAAFPRPVIFSQTEIETVGLQAAGRLQLIDSFSGGSLTTLGIEQQAMAEFGSINVEVEKVRRELDELELQLATVSTLGEQLKAVAEAEQTIALTSHVIAEKKNLLDIYSQNISVKGVITTEGERINANLGTWYTQVKQILDTAPLTDTSAAIQYFPEASIKLAEAKAKLNEALEIVSGIYYAIKGAVDAQSSEKVKLEEAARHIRKELDGLSEGAGQVLRKGQQLREQQAKLASLADYYTTRETVLNGLIQKRTEILNKLDAIREERFNRRSQIVQTLNKRLGPKIRIELIRHAQVQGFAAAISDALKGSNLRFADIARSLAENLSPRALLEAVDSFDQDLIAQVADISADRAARVLTHLRATDLGKIGCIDIDDNANFQLLDGKDYKDFSALSTGQRCTVVLPMVLAHSQKIIIVDQPEDHIDNAFIADTLIKAILARDPESQIIFSTHNPNIPVLGNANIVLQLGSDGKRGFKLTSGSLDDVTVVTAISNVMEGGADAFAKRSMFYAQINAL